MNLSIVLSLQSGGSISVDGENLSLGAIHEIFSILADSGLVGVVTHQPKPRVDEYEALIKSHYEWSGTVADAVAAGFMPAPNIADAAIPWEYRYGEIWPTAEMKTEVAERLEPPLLRQETCGNSHEWRDSIIDPGWRYCALCHANVPPDSSGFEHREEAPETGTPPAEEPEGDIGGGNSTPDVAPEPALRPAPPSKAKPMRSRERVQCPLCPKIVSPGQLGNHVRHKHKGHMAGMVEEIAAGAAEVQAPSSPTVDEWLGKIDEDEPAVVIIERVHVVTCDCIKCHTARKRLEHVEAAREASRVAAAKIAWGVHGENPPHPTVHLHIPTTE